MKDFLLVLICLFLVLLFFRDFWFKYEDFLIIRSDVIKILRCIITNREMPEKFSHLIDTLKSNLLLLMESRFYNKTEKEEIQIYYSTIERIQEKIENQENADSDGKKQTVHTRDYNTREYFDNLKKFEKIGKTKLLILDILWSLWIFAITLFFLVLISTLVYCLFSHLFSHLLSL